MYVAGDIIYRVFYHYAGTTGLVNADFTKVLYRNGLSNGTVVTVTEIGSGYYKIVLVPNQSGQWYLDVYETADTAARYTDEFVVGAASANAVSHEELNDNLLAAEATIRSTIDQQGIDEIKRLVQGLYERLNRITK